MKLKVTILRCAAVPTDHLLVDVSGENNPVEAFKDRYRPFAPRLLIFWPPQHPVYEDGGPEIHKGKTTVGIECMTFDVSDANVPMAGIVLADPLRGEDVARVDGALLSELERLGTPIDDDQIEWKTYYEVKGN